MNTTGYEGYPLYIDCQARGDPTPAITWTSISPKKTSTKQLPSHFVSHKNGTLIVEQLLATDGGRYQCVAGNRAGLNTTEIVIIIRSEYGFIPLAPSSLGMHLIIRPNNINKNNCCTATKPIGNPVLSWKISNVYFPIYLCFSAINMKYNIAISYQHM